MGITAVYAGDPIPRGHQSVFLAGPMRSDRLPSWRSEAMTALDAAWRSPRQLLVLTPEFRNGDPLGDYPQQKFEWEMSALDRADAILFWVPRNPDYCPGFATNVEFGMYVRSGRVVFGAPPDCANPERNRYPIRVAKRYGVPVLSTLVETVAAAVALMERSRAVTEQLALT